MPYINTSLTLLRRVALVSSLAALSACTTGYMYNDDLYSDVYKTPPTSTLNQDLHIFSNGDLL